MINPPVTGHMRLVVDAARGLQTFQPDTTLRATPGQPNADTTRLIKQELLTPAPPEEFKIKRNIFDEKNRNITPKDKSTPTNEESGEAPASSSAETVVTNIEKQAKSQKQPRFCWGCGQDCTRINYLRSAGPEPKPGLPEHYRLCPNCYREGRYTKEDGNASFIKIEDVNYDRSAEQGSDWSDSELYLLLHALDSEEEDWHKIANVVGTRTAEECVQKFLQLEIEDNYVMRATDQEAANNVPHYGRVPYTNAENPIMTVVSFLAAQADKNVAAAAANRAVDAMKQSLQRRMENGTSADGESQAKTKDLGKSGREDAMDVDAPSTDKEASESQVLADKAIVSTSGEISTGNPTTDLATMSLATSAARAAALASHEERQMTTLVSAALNSALEKLELKLKQFQEMEACLQMERLELEKAQQQLFLDRLAFKRRVKDVQELVRKGAMASGASSVGTKVPGLEEKLGFENVVTGRAEDDGKTAITGAHGMEIPTDGLKVKEI